MPSLLHQRYRYRYDRGTDKQALYALCKEMVLTGVSEVRPGTFHRQGLVDLMAANQVFSTPGGFYLRRKPVALS